MKEYTYQGREIDNFTINHVPFQTLKEIMEEQSESENDEAQDLVMIVEDELDNRCAALDGNWEMLNGELLINIQ